jgi:hypothetical protein
MFLASNELNNSSASYTAFTFYFKGQTMTSEPSKYQGYKYGVVLRMGYRGTIFLESFEVSQR